MKKVLLVTDDEWTRDSLFLFFLVHGARLDSAENAAEADAALAADRYDMILCDHRLPDADGCSFLESSGRRQPEAAKFLIVSNQIRYAGDRAAASGIDGVIAKPFSGGILKSIATRCFLESPAAGR